MTRALQLPDQELKLETVFEDDFSGETGQWLAEGGATVQVRDGRMGFDAWNAKPQVETVWCRQAVEGDCVVEYTVRVDPGEGNTNLNFFLYATNPDGSSVLDTTAQRTGAYAEYHKIPNYIVTYLNSDDRDKQDANTEDPSKLRVRVRFRKDPGFNLLCETWREPAIAKGRDYRFTIVVRDDRTQLYVDGEAVFDHVEAAPLLRRGHHGFRTWATRVSVDEFRISRIVAASGDGAKK
ncbi:MAG: DUF1961 family protein [Planctomycetes bacterium]|nr:DUF1961 family protein [Planctomycetota bacterium]